MKREGLLDNLPHRLESHNISVAPPTTINRLLDLPDLPKSSDHIGDQPLHLVRIPERDGSLRYIGMVMAPLRTTDLYTLLMTLAPNPNPGDQSLAGVLGDFRYMHSLRGRNSDLGRRHRESLQPGWDEFLKYYLPTFVEVLSVNKNTLMRETQEMRRQLSGFTSFLRNGIENDPVTLLHQWVYEYLVFKQEFSTFLGGQLSNQYGLNRLRNLFRVPETWDDFFRSRISSEYAKLTQGERVRLLRNFLTPPSSTLAEQFVNMYAYATNRTAYGVSHPEDTGRDESELQKSMALRITGPDTVTCILGKGVEVDLSLQQGEVIGEGIHEIQASIASEVRSTNFVVPVIHWLKRDGERKWLHYLHHEPTNSSARLVGDEVLAGLSEVYGQQVRGEALNSLIGRLVVAYVSPRSGLAWAEMVELSVDRKERQPAEVPHQYNGPVQIVIGIMNDSGQLAHPFFEAAERYADAQK